MDKPPFPKTLMEAVRMVYPEFPGRRASDLLGRKFLLSFATLNDDEVDPQEYDHHEMVGSILGIHLDESIHALVFTVSPKACGIGWIHSVDCNPCTGKWTVDTAGSIEFADDAPCIFELEEE